MNTVRLPQLLLAMILTLLIASVRMLCASLVAPRVGTTIFHLQLDWQP